MKTPVNNNTNSNESRGKLLFVSRNLIAGGFSGPGEYAKAVIECLANNGFSIEFLWLGNLPKHKIWHRVPYTVVKAEKIWMPFAWRVGNFMAPRDPWRWLWTSLWRLGNFGNRLELIRNKGFFCKFRERVDMKLAKSDTLIGDGSLPDVDSAFKFERVFETVRPDVVMVNYYVLAPLFDRIGEGAISKVVLTHNVGHAGIDRQMELACLKKADVLLAIQEDDVVGYKQAVPGKEVLLFPIPFETVDSQKSPNRWRVLFVGGNHVTNAEGLKWFLEKNWPDVQKKLPESELHVCGSVCDNFREPFPGVSFRGRLEDLTEEYAEASVVVVPLLDGSGLKIKLVDALRHGCPVVSTSIGMQGIGFIENVCALRADSPEKFSSALLRLLENDELRQDMQRAAKEVVREHFSCQSCVKPYLQWHDGMKNLK
jgi:glycosyltransferase involved in cell wall biosynthesis